MSRPERKLQKRFVVFCEGDTEYNYIDKMRKRQNVQIALKPINMHGGGYSNFLKKIKTEPILLLKSENCIFMMLIQKLLCLILQTILTDLQCRSSDQ